MDLDRVLRVGVAGGLGLGLLMAHGGFAAAQTADNVTSDGSYVVADDDGDPVVSGEGTDIVYGDVATGGTGGEVLGDPNAVYYPDLSSVPVPGGGTRTPTISGIPVGSATAGNMIDGIDFGAIIAAEEAAAAEGSSAPAEGEATATDGEAAPVEGEGAPVEGEAAPVEGETAPAG